MGGGRTLHVERARAERPECVVPELRIVDEGAARHAGAADDDPRDMREASVFIGAAVENDFGCGPPRAVEKSFVHGKPEARFGPGRAGAADGYRAREHHAEIRAGVFEERRFLPAVPDLPREHGLQIPAPAVGDRDIAGPEAGI